MNKGPKELEGRKYPARAHALTVKNHFIQKKADISSRSAIFISGEDLKLYPYCDQTAPLRQNRYFFYLSGCNIPGSHVLFDLDAELLILVLPEIDWDDVMWSGMPLSIEDAYKTFDVDKVIYLKDLQGFLSSFGKIYTTDINDENSKFGNLLTEKDPDLFWALDESRLIKDDYELTLMRHASKISDNSHYAVMSALPIESDEGHIHAEFVYHSLRQGSKFQSYDPICCSGPNCSTLHYVKNDDSMKNKHTVLIDAGAEWNNYASDVTRCFPINGDWTKEHLEIYNAVLDMQDQVMKKIKPEAHWDELHLLAHRVLIKHFLSLGIFHNGTENEIFESGVSVSFFPHGLGHLLGMDTHDVGGHPNYDDPNPLLRYLRLRRVLKENMVVTNEPGIYFSPYLVELGLKDDNKAKYVNKDVLEKYWYVGGVRIEDDILVTKDGYENFTKITSDPEEISKIVKKGLEKGRDGFHNVV
ncbi:hypothetical protein LJB42_000389 [Komagataella kurtzmanii]|nr:hypothetical protein LJB42_000389 [Komagataella kurtzmanii]